MKKILVTGALGQIGSELILKLRSIYGNNNVIATDIRRDESDVVNEGIFENLDVLDGNNIFEMCKKYNVDTLIHLAAILSAVGEQNPDKAWDINMGSLKNCLNVSRELNLKFFTPSSIAVFGNNTPKDNTSQDTIMRPSTMYGITKLSGELLCEYYFNKYNVDTRGLRFPGLISYMTKPGGGTTDYAVDIYYKALEQGKYTCYIDEDTYMDMMYMPDAIMSIINLMEATPCNLVHRNSYNISAMSFSPKEIAKEIRNYIKDFQIIYEVDSVRQSIAGSWPNSIDSSCAKKEWGFSYKYDLKEMTRDMLDRLASKIKE